MLKPISFKSGSKRRNKFMNKICQVSVDFLVEGTKNSKWHLLCFYKYDICLQSAASANKVIQAVHVIEAFGQYFPLRYLQFLVERETQFSVSSDSQCNDFCLIRGYLLFASLIDRDQKTV